MKEYGFINEGGYLVSRPISEYTEKYRDEDGEEKERIVSIAEQVQLLVSNGWKPVDPIDEEKLVCDDDYIVRLVPYDAGDHIAYRYDVVFDTQKIRNKILELKGQLADSDYKVTKCYEANLLGKALPYDMAELHTERQALRDEINKLERLLQ